MKKSIFLAFVLSLFFSTSLHLIAQETVTKQRTKSNNTNEKASVSNQVDCVVKISATANGCSIVFDNTIVSPRDAASGLPTGKRQHKPISFYISPSDNTIVEVKNSGEMDSSVPSAKTKIANSNDISNTRGYPIKGVSVKGGKNPGGMQFSKIVVSDDGFSLPADLEDGKYDMTISFTYQKIEMGNEVAKSSKSYVAGHFILEIDGGTCRSINESGVSVKSTR